jgi:hypothetical protein
MYYSKNCFLRDLDSPVIQAKVEDMFKNSTDLSQLFAGNVFKVTVS